MCPCRRLARSRHPLLPGLSRRRLMQHQPWPNHILSDIRRLALPCDYDLVLAGAETNPSYLATCADAASKTDTPFSQAYRRPFPNVSLNV